MAHVVGDIIEVSFRQKLYQQTVLNILHYRVAASSSTSSDVADNQSYADWIAGQDDIGEWLNDWAQGMVSQWTMPEVRVQKILPTRTMYAKAPTVMFGLFPAAQGIPNVSAVVTKRGQLGLRKSIGGVHFSGHPVSFYETGSTTAALTNWWNLLKNHFIANNTVPATNITYAPILFNPTSTPNWQTILAWDLATTTRTMRRRTVGLGI